MEEVQNLGGSNFSHLSHLLAADSAIFSYVIGWGIMAAGCVQTRRHSDVLLSSNVAFAVLPLTQGRINTWLAWALKSPDTTSRASVFTRLYLQWIRRNPPFAGTLSSKSTK